jgi:hypothetical protein
VSVGADDFYFGNFVATPHARSVPIALRRSEVSSVVDKSGSSEMRVLSLRVMAWSRPRRPLPGALGLPKVASYEGPVCDSRAARHAISEDPVSGAVPSQRGRVGRSSELVEDWLTVKMVGDRPDDPGNSARARRADLTRWRATALSTS